MKFQCFNIFLSGEVFLGCSTGVCGLAFAFLEGRGKSFLLFKEVAFFFKKKSDRPHTRIFRLAN